MQKRALLRIIESVALYVERRHAPIPYDSPSCTNSSHTQHLRATWLSSRTNMAFSHIRKSPHISIGWSGIAPTILTPRSVRIPQYDASNNAIPMKVQYSNRL